MKPSNLLRSFLLAVGSSLLAISSASADQTWDGGGADSNWNTAANWGSNTLPNFSNQIIFGGTTRATNVNNLTADTTIGGFSFTNQTTTQTFSISGNRITLGGDFTAAQFSSAANFPVANTDTIGIAMILNGNRNFNIGQRRLSNFTQEISESGGARNLTKQGTGGLQLSAANTYSGTTTISAGVLMINNSLAMQNSAVDTTNSIAGAAGVGLLIKTTAVTFGGLIGNKNFAATGGFLAPTITGHTAASVSALTLNLGTGASHTYSGVIANIASGMTLTKTGGGTQILTNANTYTGATTINAGTLNLGGGTANGSLDSTVLNLGGGTLSYTRTGTNAESFTTTNVTTGASAVSTTVGTNTLNLGNIVRSAGATLSIGSTGTITATNTNTNGIIGGWALIDGSAWAVQGVAPGTSDITALATYTTTTSAGIDETNYLNANMDVDSSEGAIGAAINTNSLRFNTAAANTVTLNGTGDNIIQSGGILVTSTVGNNLSTITGGTLVGSASGELIIQQHNPSNSLSIASIIANNGGATGLTKSGAGSLILSGDNSYTGVTRINEGALLIGSDAPSGSAGALGNATSSVSLRGSLLTNGAFTVARNIDVTTGAGTSIIGGNTADSSSFTGNIALSDAVTLQALTGGTVDFVTGTWTTNNFRVNVGTSGNTGIVKLSNTLSTTGGVNVNFGTLLLNSSDRLGDTTPVTVAGGILDTGTGLTDTVIAFNMSSGSLNGTGKITAAIYGLSGGTVNANLGAGTINVSTGTVTLGSAGRFTGTPTLNLTSGQLTLAGAESVGAYTQSGGTLGGSGQTLTATSYALQGGTVNALLGNGAVTVSTGTVTLGSAGRLNTSSTLVVQSGQLTLTGAESVATYQQTGGILAGSGQTLTSAATYDMQAGSVSAILGGSVGLTKSTGGTVTLSGNNSYTGATEISAGTLSAGDIVVTSNVSHLGNATSAVTLGSAGAQGTLSYTGNTDSYTRGFTIGGAGGGRLDVTTSNQTLTVGTGAVTGTGLFTVGGAGNTTISANLTHSGGLTKADAGALTLSGTGNNYTGVTAINGGAVTISHANALGSTTAGNHTTILANGSAGNASGGRLLLSGGINTAENITITGLTETGGGYNPVLTGTGTFSGTITLAGSGGIRIANANWTGTITQSTTSHGLVFQGTNSVSNAMTINGADLIILSGTTTLNAASGTGIGSTSLIQSGVLRLGVTDAIRTDRDLNFEATSTNRLNLSGLNQTVRGLISGAGAGTRTVNNDTSSTTSTLTVGNGGGDYSFNGTIINATTGTGIVALVKTGAGNQTLSGINTFTGGTRIDQGILTLGHATDTLANGGAVNVNGGTLALGTNTDTVGAVTLTSGSITGSGTALQGVLTGTGSAYDVRSGTVSAKLGGTVGLTKTTGGTVTLSGANTYSGATQVTTGTLEITGTGSINTSTSLTVSSGATFRYNSSTALTVATITNSGTIAGSGNLGTITLGGTGSVDPGNSPGILTAGATNPSGGLDYNFEMTGAANTFPTWDNATASVNDVLRLTGGTPFAANMTAANVISVYFGNGITPTAGDVFTGGFFTDNNADFQLAIASAQFQYFVYNGVTGTLYNGVYYDAYSGPSITVDTVSQSADFDGVGGNPAVNGYVSQFTVVPEPNVAALLGGLGTLALLRRRRN